MYIILQTCKITKPLQSGHLEFRPPLQQSAQVAGNRGFTVVNIAATVKGAVIGGIPAISDMTVFNSNSAV